MKLTTMVFSCILIILGMVFQTTYAAQDIFTTKNNDFGDDLITGENSQGNELSQPVDLLKNSLKYFNTESSKIYVSKN